MNRLLYFNLFAAYYILTMFFPLSWISIAGVGESAIKLMHLSIIPLGLCFLFREFRQTLLDFIKFNRFFIIFFLLVVFFNFIALAVNSEVIAYVKNFSYIIKYLAYFTLFIFLGSMSALLFKSKNLAQHITLSNTLCLVIFVLIATLTFRGGNFIVDLVKFFFTGNINGLRRELYKSIFTAAGPTGGDSDLHVNLINTLTGSFIIVHFTSVYSLKNAKNKFYSFLSLVNFCASLFFIISSISRSNIIALAFGYVIFWGCDIIFNNNLKRVLQTIAVLIVGSTFIVLFWSRLQSLFSDTSDMYAARFGELDDNIRWSLNQEAISTFTSDLTNFLFGRGAGAKLSGGKAVHNFIIGAAFQAGILGLISSCMVYYTLFFSYIKYHFITTVDKNVFVIAALMSIPLIRMMESGDSGFPTLQEWFCVAFFLGFVLCRSKTLKLTESSKIKFLYTEKKPAPQPV